MHGRRVLAVVLATSLLLIGAVGPGLAHDNFPVEPGASGSCGGGSAEVTFGEHANSLVDPAEVGSAASAVTYFAENGGECEDGYVEAHVRSAALTAQYCYSEESDGDSGDAGNGEDPTDAVTTTVGAGELNLGEVGNGTRNYPPGHADSEEKNEAYCTYNRGGEESGT